MLAAAAAAVALLAGLPGPQAAPGALGTSLGKPTAGHPSVYSWQGEVLQAPSSAFGIATPDFPKTCADSDPGLCQDITLNVPAGVNPGTLYVRIAWRHPIWKAYLYVTSPDGKTVYPSTAKDTSLFGGESATDCDLHLFDKGCGNETSIPVDEVTIPNPAAGAWKVRVAAVNIHDEAYTGIASLTNSKPLQYFKEKLAQLVKHLTKSQRINIVFAGWKPTGAELADMKANLPDEYVPAVASKRYPDANDARDAAASGLVQHVTTHYTGTDPTNSNTLPHNATTEKNF
ncbi:MAG: hypothetical protein E6G68_00880, partial [Actinobacteria bacterium]